MTPDHRLPQPKPVNRSRRAAEEDNAWARLYRDIDKPSTAAEVVKQLNKADNAEARAEHFALYVLALDTINRHKEAQVRTQRAANFLQLIAVYCLITPVVSTWRAIRWLFEVGVEAMPEVNTSPAVARVKQLKRDPAIAPAIHNLGTQPNEPSRRVDAA